MKPGSPVQKDSDGLSISLGQVAFFAEQEFYPLLYPRCDFRNMQVAIEGFDAEMFTMSDFAEFCFDAAEESVLFGLKAAFVAPGLCLGGGVAAAGAGEGLFDGGQQEKGQVGLEVAAEAGMEVEDNLRTELTATALIGFGGISESIADDDFACGECGGDDFLNDLGAVGKHHGQLGHGCHAGGFGVEEKGADLVADRSSAGLPDGDPGEVPGVEELAEESKLGGFSGAVQPLKGEEKPLFLS